MGGSQAHVVLESESSFPVEIFVPRHAWRAPPAASEKAGWPSHLVAHAECATPCVSRSASLRSRPAPTVRMASSGVRKVDEARFADEYLDDDGLSELKRQCEQLNTPPQVANLELRV